MTAIWMARSCARVRHGARSSTPASCSRSTGARWGGDCRLHRREQGVLLPGRRPGAVPAVQRARRLRRNRQHHRPAALRQAGGRPVFRPLGHAARAVQPCAFGISSRSAARRSSSGASGAARFRWARMDVGHIGGVSPSLEGAGSTIAALTSGIDLRCASGCSARAGFTCVEITGRCASAGRVPWGGRLGAGRDDAGSLPTKLSRSCRFSKPIDRFSP